MKESTRTMVYVGVAMVSVVVAVFAAPRIRDPLEQDNLGKQFYPEFDDPTAATALEVVMYDDETAQRRQFSVQQKDGNWIIPSHNNYPADAADRLANTATSLVGIKRGESRSRSAEDYEELGVIDPLDEDTQRLKGRGDRLTLKADDKVLVDLIIGKPVSGRTGFYYVRHPKEKTTYVAKLDIDLSTKFADWVETDLLKLNRDDLVDVLIDKYSFDEARGAVVPEEKNQLQRDSSSDPWKLEGLDDEAEEMNTTDVNAIVSALDDLKLIGVRKKPAGFSEQLKADEGLSIDRATRIDLQQSGFYIQQGRFFANVGELHALTSKGVLYVLRFGQIFTGSDLELEAGIEADKKQPAKKAKSDKAAKDDGEKKSGDEEDGDEEDGDEEDGDEEDGDEDSDATQGRFLFVTAQLDEKGLGSKPEPPQKPLAVEPPEAPAKPEDGAEQKEPDAKESDAKESDTKESDIKESEKKESEKKDEGDDAKAEGDEKETTGEETKEDGEKSDSKEEEKKDLEKEYQDQLKLYELEKKTWDTKLKDAQKEVDDLNRRFADWYYVISEESFKKLSLSRAQLVTEKEKPADDNPDEAKSDEAKSDEKKSDEKKPDEKKPDEKKPAAKKSVDEKKAEPAADDSKKKEPPKDEPAGEKQDSNSKPVGEKKDE